MICAICERPLPDDHLTVDKHHWIPKSKKGKDTSLLHKVCHRKIHSMWSENELRDYYNTPDVIRENSDMAKFILWVQNKPDDYYTSTRDSVVRKSKRRR